MQGDSQESYCFILSLLHPRTCRVPCRCYRVTSDAHLDSSRNQCVVFLRALVSLLRNVHAMHFPLVLNRIAKVLLSTLSVLLPTQSDIRTGPGSLTGSKGRKSRKRAHDYEGDEIFKTTTNVICPTLAHNAMILSALDGMPLTPLPPASTLSQGPRPSPSIASSQSMRTSSDIFAHRSGIT